MYVNPLKCAIITPDSNTDIEIDNNVVPKVSKFKFLGSLLRCSTPNINGLTSFRSTENVMLIKKRINKA